jgi:hypothetical protein
MLPLWLVTEAKLDQKYGAPAQNIFISGAARMNQSMVAGDIDMASIGGAVVNTVLAGGDLAAIAVGVPTYGFSLYCRAEVKDIPSLQGKVVGIMSKGASSEHAVIALLQRYNLQPGRDVKFIYLGGVREVLAAIDRGIVAAGVLSSPTTLAARRLGQKELVNIATLNLPYIHSGVATRAALRASNPSASKLTCALTSPRSRSPTKMRKPASARWRAISSPTTARFSTKPIKLFAAFFRACLTSPTITSNRCWRSPRIPKPPALIRVISSIIISCRRSKTAALSRNSMAGGSRNVLGMLLR